MGSGTASNVSPDPSEMTIEELRAHWASSARYQRIGRVIWYVGSEG